MRDALALTPAPLKEAAYAIGCTRREVVAKFVFPFARLAVMGAIMLGLGRALGEAIAVAFVVGNAHAISASLLAPGTTISATILNDFPEAVGDLWTSSLMALGLALFAISFVILAASRLMLLPLERKARR
jgi:phosphate transport system permease protein